jgi:hypothetical protein
MSNCRKASRFTTHLVHAAIPLPLLLWHSHSACCDGSLAGSFAKLLTPLICYIGLDPCVKFYYALLRACVRAVLFRLVLLSCCSAWASPT